MAYPRVPSLSEEEPGLGPRLSKPSQSGLNSCNAHHRALPLRAWKKFRGAELVELGGEWEGHVAWHLCQDRP